MGQGYQRGNIVSHALEQGRQPTTVVVVQEREPPLGEVAGAEVAVLLGVEQQRPKLIEWVDGHLALGFGTSGQQE